MNSETGQIYLDREEIKLAIQRDEPLMEITQGFAEWASGLSDANKAKVARTLANIRRCQPGLSLTKAQNLARRTTVLSHF